MYLTVLFEISLFFYLLEVFALNSFYMQACRMVISQTPIEVHITLEANLKYVIHIALITIFYICVFERRCTHVHFNSHT